ncbi:hypothetical protein HK097_006658, partial [Rhizophlyctis rosea]
MTTQSTYPTASSSIPYRAPTDASSTTLYQTANYIRSRSSSSAYKALKARRKKLENERKKTIRELRESMGIDEGDEAYQTGQMIFKEEGADSAGSKMSMSNSKSVVIQNQHGRQKQQVKKADVRDFSIMVDRVASRAAEVELGLSSHSSENSLPLPMGPRGIPNGGLVKATSGLYQDLGRLSVQYNMPRTASGSSAGMSGRDRLSRAGSGVTEPRTPRSDHLSHAGSTAGSEPAKSDDGSLNAISPLISRQPSTQHRMPVGQAFIPRQPSTIRERQSLSINTRYSPSPTAPSIPVASPSITMPPRTPSGIDRRSSFATRRPSLSRRPSELARRPSELGRRSSIIAKSSSRSSTHATPHPKPTSHRFRRVARMIGHAVHLIKFLAGVLKNPIEWDWNYDPPSLTSTTATSTTPAQATHATLTNSHDMFGVKKLFESKHFSGYLNSDMRVLFRKDPEKRTKADIDRMQMWCSKMEGLTKYHPELQRRLLTHARYERHQPNRLILREGHVPYNFYIILDGEVEETKIDRAQVIAAREKSLALAAYTHGRKSGGSTSSVPIVPGGIMTMAPARTMSSARRGFRLSEVSSAGGEEEGGEEGREVMGMDGEVEPPRNVHDLGMVQEDGDESGDSLSGCKQSKDFSKTESDIIHPTDHPRTSTKAVRIADPMPRASSSRSEYHGDDPIFLSPEHSGLDIDIRHLDQDLTKAYTSRLRRHTSGETFGSHSIETKTARQTSFTTVRETEFLVVDEVPFLEAVEGFVDEDTKHKMEMIGGLEVFRVLGSVEEVARVCGVQRFKSGKAVVVEGGRSESLYFIRSGTCRVVKLVPFIKTYTDETHYILQPVSKYIERQQQEAKLKAQEYPYHSTPTLPTLSPHQSTSHSSTTSLSTTRTSSTSLSSISQTNSQSTTSTTRPSTTFLTSLPPTATAPSPPRPLSAPSHAPFLSPKSHLISKLLTIDTLGPSDHFGEGTIPLTSALPKRPTSSTTIGTGPSPVSIICQTAVECLVLSKIDLHRLAALSESRQPSLSRSFSTATTTNIDSYDHDEGQGSVNPWRILKDRSRITYLQSQFGGDMKFGME